MIDDVPILADLGRDGAFGVAGPVAKAEDVARGLIIQTLGLHSPAEVVAVAMVSPGFATGLEWLKWMPHTSSAHSPIAGVHLADSPSTTAGLLAQLEGVIDSRVNGKAPSLRGAVDGRPGGDSDRTPQVPSIVVVIADDAPADRGRLTGWPSAARMPASM